MTITTCCATFHFYGLSRIPHISIFICFTRRFDPIHSLFTRYVKEGINFSTALNKSFSKRSAMSIVDVSLEQILSCLFPSNVFSSSRSRMDTSALRKSREPPRAFASQCERCLLGPFSFPSSVFFSTTASTFSIPILSIYRYYFLMYFRYTTFFRRLADFHRLRFASWRKKIL